MKLSLYYAHLPLNFNAPKERQIKGNSVPEYKRTDGFWIPTRPGHSYSNFKRWEKSQTKTIQVEIEEE